MVGELALIIESVRAISGLVDKTRTAIDSIQSGKRVQNDEVKKALLDRLDGLEMSIRHVGALADAAEDYGRALENVNELLTLCRRAERILADAGRLPADGEEAQSIWRILDTLLQTIAARSDVPQQSTLGRVPWFDDQDEGQMAIYVNQFTRAYERMSTSVEHRMVNGLQDQVRDMVANLEGMGQILKTTMYDKILRALQGLAPR